MKNILILTDFSKNAAHAARLGVVLARQMHTNILLFNSGVSQPVAPVYVGGPTVIDEMSLMQEENEFELKEFAESLNPYLSQAGTEWKPTVEHEVGIGLLAYRVEDIIKEKNIEMVIMGEREGGRIDHFLTGSDTYSVIDHASRPVLIVPEKSELSQIKKVIFATDFSAADIKAIYYLIKLGYLLNYHLEIAHINLLDDDDIVKNIRKIEFMKHMKRLRYDHIEIKEVYGEDIIDRLNKMCQSLGTNMLAFTHYKGSFLSRLFGRSITKKALAKQINPLMVFPAKFTE